MNINSQEERRPGFFDSVIDLWKDCLFKINQNLCRMFMTRVYFSKLYRVFYLLAILVSLLSAFLLIYIWDKSTAWWMIVLVSLLSAFLVFDAGWRAGTQGLSTFIKDWKSLLDLAVTLANLTILLVGVVEVGLARNISLLFGFMLTAIKWLVMFYRLYSITYSIHRTELSIIDLNDVSEVDRNVVANKSGIVN